MSRRRDTRVARRRRTGATAIPAVLAALAAVAGCADRGGEDPARRTRADFAPGAKIVLVDNVHSPARDTELGLERGDFRYTALHGMRRFFDHLEANGYPAHRVTRETTPELTAGVLAEADILFIDFLALDCSDYTAREIETVHRWVERGGALLVLADHTNVYDNARRTNALVGALGITVEPTTAMDRTPGVADETGTWLRVRDFAAHPITHDVRAITFMNGATLATEHGVAFLGEGGFADAWQPNRPPAFRGNGRRDPGEPAGRLPLVAAREHGAGRVVVLGDENIPGNQQLFMADNFEFMANVFAWLGGEDVAASPLRRPPPARLRVAFDLESAGWNVWGNACNFYHPFFVAFNQTPGVLARGVLDLARSWDVLVFTDPETPLAPAQLAAVRAHLVRGGTVILLTDVTRARAGALALLEEFVPQVEIEGRRRLRLRDLPSIAAVPTAGGDAKWPAVSNALAVSGLHVSGGYGYPRLQCPWDVEQAKPYAHLITATGGEPFLQARVGDRSIDIARTYAVGRGQLVVFFQDGLFRNETLGIAEHIPTGPTVEAFQVVYALIDWLDARHARSTAVP